jgi:hypothetical protein
MLQILDFILNQIEIKSFKWQSGQMWIALVKDHPHWSVDKLQGTKIRNLILTWTRVVGGGWIPDILFRSSKKKITDDCPGCVKEKLTEVYCWFSLRLWEERNWGQQIWWWCR